MKLSSFFASAPAVSAAEAQALLDDGAALLDVRERVEWNQGHAPQAIHVPLSQIARATEHLDKDVQVLVLCRSGHRAKPATAHLRSLGYNATTITGGMGAWASAGGQVIQ